MRFANPRLGQRRDILGRQAEDANGACDVLNGMLAQIGEGEPQLVANLFVRSARNIYAAGLAQRFEPGSDIDAVPQNVITVNNNIANVHSDAKDDLLGCRHRYVPRQHTLLDRYRAPDGVDDARKLKEEPIAGSLDHPPAACLDGGVEKLGTMSLERDHRSDLVGAHQTAVSDYIHGDDSSQSPFYDRRAHAHSANVCVVKPRR